MPQSEIVQHVRLSRSPNQNKHRKDLEKSMRISLLIGLVFVCLFGATTSATSQHVPQGTPATLVPVDHGLDAQWISGNNLLDPGLTHAMAYTGQQIRRGSWVEATLNANPNDGAEIGVVLPEDARFLRQRGPSWPLGAFYSGLEFRDSGAVGTNRFVVYHGLGGPGLPPIDYTGESLGDLRQVRVRVEVGDKLRYYRDYTGLNSVPFYESPDTPPAPLVGFVICITINNAGCSVSNVRFGQTVTIPIIHPTPIIQ